VTPAGGIKVHSGGCRRGTNGLGAVTTRAGVCRFHAARARTVDGV